MEATKNKAARPGAASAKHTSSQTHGKHTAPSGIDAILPRLDGVRDRGAGRWLARCPAHDDRSPSLSIRVTDEGTILLHCFASCAPQHIIDALGLTWGDLYREPYRAAFAAACGMPFEPVKVDPLDHERMILKIARHDLSQGIPLSLEDRARAELAAERLEVK